MKKILPGIFFLIPLIAFGSLKTDSVVNLNKIPKDGVLLDKGWKFHTGDNPDWAKPGFDDTKWDTIDPAKDIYYLPRVKEAGISWFRLKLQVDPSLFNKTIGMIIYQTGASDVYLNGKLIYHFGKIDGRDKKRTVRTYGLPLSLKFDAKSVQEITARFYYNKSDFIINYLTPNYAFKVVLKNVNDMLGHALSESNSYILQDILLIALYILLAVTSLFLYFSHRFQLAYLYIGLYCLGSIVSAFFRIVTYSIPTIAVSAASACYLFSHIVSVCTVYTFFFGMYRLFNQKKSYFYYFMVLYAIASIPVFLFFYPWSNIFALSFTILIAIDGLIVQARAIREGHTSAWILLLTLLVFLLMFICFILISLAGDLSFGLNVAAASLFVIPIGLCIFLANEFARTGRSLQLRIFEVQRLSQKSILQEQEKQQILVSQNERLEQQVTERTAELNQSLTHLKATQTQLIQSEKMASLGELTAGIAHEIQNPLNFVNNFSEVNTELISELKLEADKGDLQEIKAIAVDIEENSKKINIHGNRAAAIVKGMLEHSRASTGKKELTDINALADEYLRLSYHGLRAKDKSFNAETVTDFDVELHKINVIPQDIGRVLLNLFNNAFYAVNQKAKTAGADYKPEVSVTTSHENDKVTIVVKDNGVGIPDTIKEKVMQPFFTTKPTGEGTGLGLSLTYDLVVKGHGGSITVNSVEGEGSDFIVTLPVN